MMKKNKGFTLIELLSVIIILAVIALIATPIVLNVVDNARKSAAKDSAYGLLDSAKLYYMESLLDESKSLSGNLIDKINVSGRKPNSGEVYVNNKGEIALSVVYDKVCFTKNYEDADLTEIKDLKKCNNEKINATEINYTSPNSNCNNVSCVLDELYERMNSNED